MREQQICCSTITAGTVKSFMKSNRRSGTTGHRGEARTFADLKADSKQFYVTKTTKRRAV